MAPLSRSPCDAGSYWPPRTGSPHVAIRSAKVSVNRKTVILWRQRFAEQRLDGLWEIATGRGRKPNYDTKDRRHCRCNFADQTRRHDALELPNHGQESGHEQVND